MCPIPKITTRVVLLGSGFVLDTWPCMRGTGPRAGDEVGGRLACAEVWVGVKTVKKNNHNI